MSEPTQMITTRDNPFNPFIQWSEWFAFDTSKGYNTCGYLSRLTPDLSDDEPDDSYNQQIRNAMVEMISTNIDANYVIVTKENFESVMKESQKLKES